MAEKYKEKGNSYFNNQEYENAIDVGTSYVIGFKKKNILTKLYTKAYAWLN